MGGVTGSVINDLGAVEPQKFDILFFNRVNRFCDGDLDKARELFGCKIAVDIDDYWNLPPDHIYHELYKRQEAPLIEANIRQADLVIASTSRLAEKAAKLNNNVQVVPNAIPFGEDQFTAEREASERVRIFWAGGSTHEKDIDILRGPVRRLTAHKEMIEMIIGGYSATSEGERYIWDTMARSFTDGLRLPFQIFPGVPPDQYMNLYNNADICLVPLRGIEWNGYKSNLKILEAAVKKIPAIVSAVAPYIDDADAPVIWVNKSSDWYKNIKTLIYDKSQREELGSLLNEWGRKNYDLREINGRRLAAFANLAKA